MAYVGFSKLKSQLAHRPGVTNPGALAASIGRRKYGAGAMRHAAATGHGLKGVPAKGSGGRQDKIRRFLKKGHMAPPTTAFGPVGSLEPGTRIKRGYTGRITEDDPRFNPRKMGNHHRGGNGHR